MSSVTPDIRPTPYRASGLFEHHLFHIGVLGLLVLAMFGDVLFRGGGRVLGSETTDALLQFVAWRDFGFRELANGNYALWNPHIYGGAPYAGGMQAALLYPVNWLFMVLPLATAMNWTTAINVWLAGSFMYLWGRGRGLHPLAAWMGGALLMFCAPHFLHIYAGHMTNLPAMTWAPLIFMSIDRWFESNHRGWLLAGMFAVAMQLFAGHPQYVFYTGIAASLYFVFRLLGSGYTWRRRATLMGGFFVVYAGGALLSAAHLLVGMQGAAETIRNRPLPWEFASMFGFPPENFLTLVAPYALGDMMNIPYWGRSYLWEASLFFGVTGLVAAIYGAFAKHLRDRWALIAVVMLMVVLACGKYTPLFGFLYEFVPGFDRFRSVAKFDFPCVVFLILLAAIGVDRVLRENAVHMVAVLATLAGAVSFAALAVFVRSSEWLPSFERLASYRETYISDTHYQKLQQLEPMVWASNSLFIAALTLLCLAALMHLRRSKPLLAYTIPLLAVAEVFVFARMSRTTFDMEAASPPAFRRAVAKVPAGTRIMNLYIPNSAMLLDAYDVWGFDPGVVRRYAEFMHWTQFIPSAEQPHFDRNSVTQYLEMRQMHPLLSLVRLHAVLVPQADGAVRTVAAEQPPMPRLSLMTRYRVSDGFEQTMATLVHSSFDFRQEVVLEELPFPGTTPTPDSAGATGTVSIIRESTDEIEIVAENQVPSVLLMTDAWTPAWHARPVEKNDSREYRVLPADHALRAIPLSPGKHHFVLEYVPREYDTGRWISCVSWLLFACGVGMLMRRSV